MCVHHCWVFGVQLNLSSSKPLCGAGTTWLTTLYGAVWSIVVKLSNCVVLGNRAAYRWPPMWNTTGLSGYSYNGISASVAVDLIWKNECFRFSKMRDLSLFRLPFSDFLLGESRLSLADLLLEVILLVVFSAILSCKSFMTTCGVFVFWDVAPC